MRWLSSENRGDHSCLKITVLITFTERMKFLSSRSWTDHPNYIYCIFIDFIFSKAFGYLLIGSLNFDLVSTSFANFLQIVNFYKHNTPGQWCLWDVLIYATSPPLMKLCWGYVYLIFKQERDTHIYIYIWALPFLMIDQHIYFDRGALVLCNSFVKRRL